MPQVKPPKTYDEQLKLIKDKGFVVDDEQYLLKFLECSNYYKLSAYFLPFKISGSDFLKDISIKTVCETYLFDCDLRKIMYNVIQFIELDIKTKIAYFFSHKYGALGYLEQKNFSKKHDHKRNFT